MANTLMFEVGVGQAVQGLDKLKKELDQFVTDYDKKMKLQVDVKNLETFINALKSIGSGEQLKPLLQQVERLQNRLSAMNDKGQYFDMIRGEAAAAAEAVKIAEQRLEHIKKSGNTNLIANAKLDLQNAQREAARASEVLASATSRLSQEQKAESSTASDLNSKIEQLSQSITSLSGKTFSVNMGNEFKTWAEQVQALVAQVKELVIQMEKLHAVQVQGGGNSIKEQNEQLLEQAKIVGNLQTQLLKLQGEGLKIPKTADSYKAIEEYDKLFPKFTEEQAKFNEMLQRGATVTGSYAQVIQQLGDKYNFSAEQLQKLTSLIASGDLQRAHVQRGLGIGYNKAEDVVKTIEAVQKLKQEEAKPAPQGGLFDPQKFTSLQEAIDKIIGEINRLREAFAGIGKIEGIEALKTSVNGLQVEVNSLVYAMMKITGAIHIDKSAEEIASWEKKIAELKAQYEQLQTLVQQTTKTVQQQTTAANNAATAAQNAAQKDADDTKKANVEKQRQIKLLSEVESMVRQIGSLTPASTGMNPQQLNNMKQLFENLQKSLTTIPPTKSLQELSAEFSSLKSSSKSFFNEIKKGEKAVDSIRLVRYALKQLNDQMASGQSSPRLESLRNQLQSINREMHNLIKEGNFEGLQSLFAGHKGMSDGVVNIIRAMVTEMKRLGISTQETAGFTSHLTSEEQRLAQALGQSNMEMKGQSQILSDLKMYAYQYLSVWGAIGFINSIKETGGLLEQQRLSLSAILGDMSKANDLFGKVKDMAIKSPFGVVQIDQMTKQLAAYSFEYHELFDWTKRLADISAATGTSVDRLALALGHVRSEAALSGYTLRQFSMANVPLLKMLAENRGVSAKEIRSLVRKKEISDKEVQDVLLKLTNEGGMFYNAQEVMSQALNARFKNLRDSFDIMFGDIAEGTVGDIMKAIATGLTEASRRWQAFAAVIVSAGTALGIYKLSMMAVNAGMKVNAANILASKVNLKTLTAEQVEHLAVTKQITREQLVNAVATKRLTLSQAELAAEYFVLDKNILRTTASMSRFKLAMQGIGNSSIVAMLTNPWTAALLAIEAVIGAVMAYRSWSEKVLGNINNELDLRRTAQKDITKYFEGREGEEKPTSDRDLSNEIEQMKTILKNSGLYTEELEKQVGLAPSLSKEYDVLIDKMNQANDTISKMGASAEVMADAVKATSSELDGWDFLWGAALGGMPGVAPLGVLLGQLGVDNSFSRIFDFFLNDDMNKNVDDLNKSLGNMSRQLSVLEQYRSRMQEAADAMAMTKEHAELANLPLEEQLRILADSDAAWEEFVAKAGDGSDYFVTRTDILRDATKQVTKDWQELTDDDVPRLMEKLAKDYNMNAEEFKKYAKKNKIEFSNMLDVMLAEAKAKSPLIAAQLKNAFYGWINGDTSYGLTPPKETEEQKRERERIEAIIRRNNKVKGYGSEGKFTLGTLLKYARTKGLGDANGNGIWSVDWVAKYFTGGEGYESGYKKIADDYKKVKSEIKAATSAGDTKRVAELERKLKPLEYAVDALDIDTKEKKGGKGGHGSEDDQDAKDLRERMRILKEAADSYKYWRKAVGEEGAEAHVNREFGDVLKEIGFEFKDVKDLRKTITKELSNYENLYETSLNAGKKRPKLLEAIKEGYKIEAGLGRHDFEKTADEFASKVQIELDGLTRAWEMFNSVREATGNVELAVQLSGADYRNGQTRNLADALKEKIQKDFEAVGGGIAFDMNLSDKDIEEQIKKAVPAAGEEQIKGLVEEYKKWRDLQRDVLKADMDVFAKLVGSAKDYDSQLAVINDKLQKQIEANENLVKLGKITRAQADRANGIATVQANDEIWKMSLEYINLMNYSLSMTREEVDAGINKAVDMLNRKMQANIITAKEYADEMAKIRNIQTEWNKSSFFGIGGAWGAGMTGGFAGRRNYYQSRVNAANAEMAQMSQKKAKNPFAVFDYATFGRLRKQAEGDQGRIDKIDSTEKLLSDFDALSKAMEPVVNLFEQMGLESVGSILGAGQNALSQAASMGSGAAQLFGAAAGPYGAAIGAGLSIASSLFGMHDESLQKEIDALKENNEALEANTEVIKLLRERTLGYDTGNLRRQMSSMYNDKKIASFFGIDIYDEATRAMKEFYNSNTNGNGYTQELKNLREERQNYMKMYNAEADKKDSSSESLLEYKQKIAELDEQIMYFTEDLANELWGIDIKSWADQIGDALWTAFENGEDALEAFHDTAKDIISDVAKRMVKLSIIEPVFQRLQKALFGEWNAQTMSYSGGAIKYDSNGNIDMKGSEGDVLRVLAQYLGKGGEMEVAAEGAEQFYKWVEQITGMDLSSDDSDTTSKIIQGGFSEEETGLLLSYVNAIRADLSVQRQDVYTIAQKHLPEMIQIMTRGNNQLISINQNVDAMKQNSDVIANKISSLESDIHGLKIGTWKMPVH